MIKYIDMVENKEYLHHHLTYKKTNGILYYKSFTLGKWLVSIVSMREIVETFEFEEKPWEPEYDDEYYFPDFTNPGGIRGSVCRNDDFDKMVKRAVGCYKTKEEARAKARELGWLE